MHRSSICITWIVSCKSLHDVSSRGLIHAHWGCSRIGTVWTHKCFISTGLLGQTLSLLVQRPNLITNLGSRSSQVSSLWVVLGSSLGTWIRNATQSDDNTRSSNVNTWDNSRSDALEIVVVVVVVVVPGDTKTFIDFPTSLGVNDKFHDPQIPPGFYFQQIC